MTYVPILLPAMKVKHCGSNLTIHSYCYASRHKKIVPFPLKTTEKGGPYVDNSQTEGGNKLIWAGQVERFAWAFSEQWAPYKKVISRNSQPASNRRAIQLPWHTQRRRLCLWQTSGATCDPTCTIETRKRAAHTQGGGRWRPAAFDCAPSTGRCGGPQRLSRSSTRPDPWGTRVRATV